EREPDQLLRTIVHVHPAIAIRRGKGQRYRLSDGGQRKELFRPQHRAALAAMPEDHRRPGAGDADAVLLDVLLRHELIEELHATVGKEMVRRTAVIGFFDRALAIYPL